MSRSAAEILFEGLLKRAPPAGSLKQENTKYKSLLSRPSYVLYIAHEIYNNEKKQKQVPPPQVSRVFIPQQYVYL